MDTTWAESEEWERSTEDDGSGDNRYANSPDSSPGSYHCKSALRDHDSNMKLFMYRKSYKYLSSISGTLPYDEDSLLLLPDIWRCFYLETHGLNRIKGEAYVREHTQPSPAFATWVEHTLKEIASGDLLLQCLASEESIWGVDVINVDNFRRNGFPTLMKKIKKFLIILYYFNLCVLVLNYRYNPKRPDIGVEIPGIVEKRDEDYYCVRYNDHLKVHIYLDGVRFVTPSHDRILQKDLFLNLCDKLNERLNVSVGTHLISYIASYNDDQERSGKEGDLTLVRDTLSIIAWGDDLLYRFRNHAFELIGKYEAYCVSAILLYDDPNIWDNTEFQNNLLKDDLDNNPELHPHSVKLCQLLKGMNISNIAEIHGLWRLWGHPIIDLQGGLKKMENTCLKEHNIDKHETEIGVRTFKMIFATNYFKKHHHYPLCNVSSKEMIDLYKDHLSDLDKKIIEDQDMNTLRGSYIREMIEQNKFINDKNSRYRHEDWDHIIFLQNFQIPQSLNLATMIKDKAISQTRSELIASITSRNSVFDPMKRRGILKWLSEQTHRLKNYLWSVDQRGLPENDLIIGLYPKERELKTKARFFSLMSYNFRMYVTATEEILGKYLLPYFPMITMSDTLLNMVIRLYNMTSSIGKGQNKVIYSMNIDFSKWNQNMREKTNAGVFKTIDRILGFRNLISRTHSLFRSSYLYLCSGEYIPSVVRGMLQVSRPYSRIGDESGKEGLRQKGWTLTTICDIISLAFLHGVQIELIGGGDNQVLTVEIRSSGRNLDLSDEEQMNKIRNKMNRFRNSLAKKMEKRGLPLKLEETWISHRLLMYNKIMYLDGVPLPGRLKVISRLFSNSNEGISTLGNITSTLGTGYQSLSSKDYTPALAWIASRLFTLIGLSQYYLFNPVCGTRRLDKQILLSKQRTREGLTLYGDDLITARTTDLNRMENFTSDHTLSVKELYYICLYFHKILGGPGIGTPLSYIMKGFPDILSESLAFNYFLIERSIDRYLVSAVENLTSVQKANIKHWEHLLEDPVSVNHDAPPHGIAALREQAEKVLKCAVIKNTSFKKLIDIGGTEFLRRLSESLCKPRQLEPRLLHDIAGATIPGYVNTILSKVDQSSTLNKLASECDVVTEVYNCEMIYYMFLARKIKCKIGHTRTKCPTRDAQMLRNVTWGKDIIGVTTPHPFAFLNMTHHKNTDPLCDQNYISILVKRDVPCWVTKRGPFRPYFGSYTAEKFKTSVLASAYGDEDILKRALKIQKLLGWRYTEASPMYSLIQSILRCVTNSDPNKFKPNVEEITGDVEHRYHDMATKHGGIPSNLIKLYTYTSCNTTTFSDHSKGAANESLHFQASMIYASMISIMATYRKSKVMRLYHFHESCKSCIAPVRAPIDDDIDLSDVKLVMCPRNDLMYIKEEDIPIHFHNCVEFYTAEKKKANMEERGANIGNMKEFSEPKERGSWLLLLIVSIYNDSGTLKSSAIRLMLDSLSLAEMLICLTELKNLHMVNKCTPTGLYDITDIEDMVNHLSSSIEMILNSAILVQYAQEHGVVYPSRKDEVSGYIYDLLKMNTFDSGRLISTAVCKYQDPEYQLSRRLIICSKTPSSKICIPCIEAINHKTRPKSLVTTCGIHGDPIENIEYHLYSLDKLSRFKGPPYDPNMQEHAGKRKRNISLFKSIKIARGMDLDAKTRIRRESFLFSNKVAGSSLLQYISQDWRKSVVSIEGEDENDKISSDVEFRAWDDNHDIIRGPESDAISVCHTILGTIFDHLTHNRPGDLSSDITASIELVCTPRILSIYTKAIILLDDVLKYLNFPCLEIRFLVSDITSLETTNLGLISELSSRYSLMKPDRAKVRVYDIGDGSYDVAERVSKDDIVIMTTSTLLSFPSSSYYISCSSIDAYSLLGKISEQKRAEWRWTMLQPIKTVVDPYPILLRCDRKPYGGYYQISDMLTSDALEKAGPSTDRVICNSVVMSMQTSTRTSLIYEVYKLEAGIPSGITSESLYRTCMDKLSSGLKRFALEARHDEILPWRCVLIVRIILALRILTDIQEIEAVKYYSKFHSLSYKKGTYKTILLHKRRISKKDCGKMINWTPNSIGTKLHDTVKELSKWMSITWKSDHGRCPRIDL